MTFHTVGGFAALYEKKIKVPPEGCDKDSDEWLIFLRRFNYWRRRQLNTAACHQDIWDHGCIPYQLVPYGPRRNGIFAIVTTADQLFNGPSFQKLLTQLATSEDHEIRYIHSARPETREAFKQDIEELDIRANDIKKVLTVLLEIYFNYKQRSSGLYEAMHQYDEDRTNGVTDDDEGDDDGDDPGFV